MTENIVLSTSPHIHSGESTSRIMFLVLISFIPAFVMSIVLFGLKALFLYTVTTCSCVLFEAVFNKLSGRKNSIPDGSALITGVVLTMNLPVSVPWWVAVVGAFVAIIIAKMLFGGLGGNPFNPSLVARVFLLISFPVQMTKWSAPVIDAMSGATVLGAAKTYAQAHDGSLIGFALPELWKTFLGVTAGSIGETSALALLIGGIFLLLTRVITWHIPLTYIGTVFLLTLGHNIIHPGTILPPLYQITGGGLILGAFYMATDYVTSPLMPIGKIIFGIGCGVITVVIRIYGGYPEGVAFSILIMNAVTPFLDKYLRPRPYGEAL